MEQTLKDEIGKLIDNYNGIQLWQESVKLAIKSNPTIAKDILGIIKDNKITRSEMIDPKFGTNQSQTMRLALRMPTVVEDILSVVDPDNFPMKNGKEGEAITRKLAKAFPEFSLAEKS